MKVIKKRRSKKFVYYSIEERNRLNLLIVLLVLFFALFIILAGLFLKEFVFKEISFAPTNTLQITDCRVLDQADTEYLLMNDVSASETCFIIASNNIVLNGQGHTLTYGTGGINDKYGIRADGVNTIGVKNLRIDDGNILGTDDYPFYATSVNDLSIENVNIYAKNSSILRLFDTNNTRIVDSNFNGIGPEGINLRNSNFGFFENDTIVIDSNFANLYQISRAFYLISDSNYNFISNLTILANSNNQHGIQIQGSSHNLIEDSYITTNGDDADSIRLIGGFSTNNSFNRVLLRTTGNNDASGILVANSNNSFLMKDSLIDSTNSGSSDFEVASSSVSGEWKLVNVSFIDKKWGTGGMGALSVYWYFDSKLIDLNGNSLSGALVSATDRFNNNIFSVMTDGSGNIQRQILREYDHINGGQPVSYSNYTITYSKAGYSNSIELIEANSNKYIQELLNVANNVSSPTIAIQSPKAQTYITNVSLELSYRVTSSETLSSCKYNFDSGANVSGSCNLNTTFNISAGSHNLYVFASDINGNNASSNVSFQVSPDLPGVVLLNPRDHSFLNNQNNIYFEYIPSDAGSIANCTLYADLNGTYSANITDNVIINGVQNIFGPFNLSARNYNWNILCIDNRGNQNFAFSNYSFGIDLVNPAINNITSPAVYPPTILCSRTVQLRYDLTESNIEYCFFNVTNSSNTILDNINISSCTSKTFTVNTANEKKVLKISLTAVDKAGNRNYYSSDFYVDEDLDTCISSDNGNTVDTTINSNTNNAANNQANNSQSSNIDPGSTNTGTGAQKKVPIEENASTLFVSDGERIILSLNGQDYDAFFEINNGVVNVKIGSGNYEIEEGQVITIIVGTSRIYIGAKEIKSSSASLLLGLSKESITDSISTSKGVKRNVAYLLMIIILVALIGAIIGTIYHVLRSNQDDSIQMNKGNIGTSVSLNRLHK